MLMWGYREEGALMRGGGRKILGNNWAGGGWGGSEIDNH